MASARVLLVSILFSSLCFAPSPASAGKVRLSLYYESLCPYCSRFIVNFLSKIFDDGLISIVDLDLIPYGNARVGSNKTISCQHGPYECVLNAVEACAIDTWPDVFVHFKFINCVERLVVEHKYLEWETCFLETGLDAKPVLDCYDSEHGKKLELKYAAQTGALQPPHTYVPWVVVNGQPLYEDYEDFEAYVCKAYNGDQPKICEQPAIKGLHGRIANQAEQVSYASEEFTPTIIKEDPEMKIKMAI